MDSPLPRTPTTPHTRSHTFPAYTLLPLADNKPAGHPPIMSDLWRRARWNGLKQLHGLVPGGGVGLTKRALMGLMLCVAGLITFSTMWLPMPSISTSFGRSASRRPVLIPPANILEVAPNHAQPLPRDSTLADRLAAWRAAPGVGWEQSNFIRWNLETCSNFEQNQNKDLLVKSSLIWAQMNSTTIVGIREKMAAYLEQHEADGAFEDLPVRRGGRGMMGEGRGMVFTAGNADTLSRVVITLKYLRKYLHSNLPAAVYHFPSERPAPDSPLIAELHALNATLVEAVGSVRDDTRTKNYHLKAMAIVECEWAEVIYLDSDNIPAADPALLFDGPNYKRLGAMFWPDYWKTSPVNPIWQIIGVQCRDEWEQEAGQIIIDKRRHLDALLLSLYMLIDWKFWYFFSDGDKDVFRFSFLALRKRWALPGRWVGGGALPGDSATGYCAHTMQQYDHRGEPMFIHYNLMKQIPSGVGRGYSWGRTKQLTKYPQPAHTPSNYSAMYPVERHPVPYIDPTVRGGDDVEADMLVNADDDGYAVQPGTDEVRRRALLERGIKIFFHGGVYSALCINMDWVNPTPQRNLPDGIDSLGIHHGEGPLEIVDWRNDPRLVTFEDDVYNEGFTPGAPGF